MQKKVFVDTNIFIYSLYNIDQVKHTSCINLLEKALNGKIYFWTTEWVIAELVWFLLRKGMDWTKIKKFLVFGVFASKGLDVRGGKWLLPVISSCDKGEEFVDMINKHLVSEEKIKTGYSYDKALDNWKGFKRLEP